MNHMIMVSWGYPEGKKRTWKKLVEKNTLHIRKRKHVLNYKYVMLLLKEKEAPTSSPEKQSEEFRLPGPAAPWLV